MPLTAPDLADLEALLTEIGSPELVEKAKSEAHGLGLFVRSLVGLDREAAKAALSGFVGGKALTANQIEFVNLLVEHLTARGALDAGVRYESPFTPVAPQGPGDLFPGTPVAPHAAALDRVRANATP